MKRAKKVNWTSTPAAARHNKPITITLPPEAIAVLDEIGPTRSGAIAELARRWRETK